MRMNEKHHAKKIREIRVGLKIHNFIQKYRYGVPADK